MNKQILNYYVIDFDSTFIKVEALDELAKISLDGQINKNEIVHQIESITNKGMSGEMPFSESLTERVELLHANKTHIEKLIHELT